MDWEKIKNWLINFGKTTGVSLLKALAVLIAGIIIIKILLAILNKIFGKSKMEKTTQTFILSVSRFAFNMVLIILVLQTMGLETTWLVGLLTAAGLAIGLSLQNTIANLANGLVIISTKPFHKGDFININGIEGSVVSIKMLTTEINTFDNKIVIIPNSSIVTNNIINYTALKKRRVDITFEVAYETDLSKVQEVIREVMLSNGKVYTEPAPFISLKTLNESGISVFSNCWCDAEDYWEIYYYVMNNVFNEFKKANISIPFNQVEVRMRTDKVTMPYMKGIKLQRVEKFRPDDSVLGLLSRKFKHLGQKEEPKPTENIVEPKLIKAELKKKPIPEKKIKVEITDETPATKRPKLVAKPSTKPHTKAPAKSPVKAQTKTPAKTPVKAPAKTPITEPAKKKPKK